MSTYIFHNVFKRLISVLLRYLLLKSENIIFMETCSDVGDGWRESETLEELYNGYLFLWMRVYLIDDSGWYGLCRKRR